MCSNFQVAFLFCCSVLSHRKSPITNHKWKASKKLPRLPLFDCANLRSAIYQPRLLRSNDDASVEIYSLISFIANYIAPSLNSQRRALNRFNDLRSRPPVQRRRATPLFTLTHRLVSVGGKGDFNRPPSPQFQLHLSVYHKITVRNELPDQPTSPN